MSGQQQRGVEILTRLEAGVLNSTQAADLLGVSDRQIRRLRHHVVTNPASEQVPKPARSPARPMRPSDPNAKARQRA